MSDGGERARVKICGITRVADAERAVELGADLLGLNFWPGSPRCLPLGRAAEIAAAVAGRSRLVGVFVNAPPRLVEEAAEAARLDLLQFHGDETPEEIAPWGGRALVALRIEAGARAPDLSLYPRAWGFLFEARRSGSYGGTGAAWDYGTIAALEAERPVLVAGGIRPQTARHALIRSRAWGVDVCSGVESAPGIKDPELLAALFSELRGDRSG